MTMFNDVIHTGSDSEVQERESGAWWRSLSEATRVKAEESPDRGYYSYMYGNNKYDCILSIYMHFFTIIHLEYISKGCGKKGHEWTLCLALVLKDTPEWTHFRGLDPQSLSTLSILGLGCMKAEPLELKSLLLWHRDTGGKVTFRYSNRGHWLVRVGHHDDLF